MELLLWRHAEAGGGSPDIARTLTPRGQKQAQRMARWLEQHAPAELRILVSQWNTTPRDTAPYRVIQFAVNPVKP